MHLLVLSGLLAAPAHAFESEPQPFVLEDTAELWNNSEFDTSWVPSGSPLQVRFQIQSSGGAFVGMDGTGHLTWPDAFVLDLEPTPGTGWIIVDAALEAVTAIKFDVFGFSWEQEIDRRGLQVEGDNIFDPFLLQGAEPDIVEVDYSGSETELVNFDVSVFTGVSVNFTANIGPEASTTFQGVNWWTEDGALAQSGATADIEPSGDPWQTVETSFVGRWTSALDLVLTPVFSVSTPLGDAELVRVDIPIPLGSDDFEQEMPATVLEFPLPIITPPVTEYDFGEVNIGELVNWEMEIGNDGALDLEGAIGMTGSPYFSSFPDAFLAGPGVGDGVVVTFAPEAEGDFSATLILESNDPLNPIQEIVVSGTAIDPDAGEDGGGGDGSGRQAKAQVIETEVGCGCGTTGAPAWPGLMAVLAGGLAFVRRRRADEE